ncbi:T-cell immunoglobulin and mucin domain-containing protein 4-like isoform X2 [Eleginops maclovinus]|uniref:T-cell immunoglobulin and mucin domain-containing protein 4-like isoform X2 n=1 Tax=Eleginops maclovinus TaxID=56733 RepID=UPI0030807E7C
MKRDGDARGDAGSNPRVSGGSGLRVPSVSGQDVTLPCTYDIKTYGPLAVCWIRGDIPNSGCSKQLTASDGRQVVFGGGASSRYQLLGRLLDGDVSLTVLKVSELDAGRYGCRVEIPGWFNDEKHHIDLTVERAPETTTPSHTETASEQTHTHTAADLMSSQILQTNSSFSAEAGGSSVFLLCVVLGMLAVLTLVAAVLVLASQQRRLSNNSEPRVLGPVASELQLQSRSLALENIYQVDEDGGRGDGGEYEVLP